MRSALAKPLHHLCGRPLIDHVLDAIDSVRPAAVIVVLSPSLNANVALLSHLQLRLGDRLRVAVQAEPNGTGDALLSAVPYLDDADTVLVGFADHPLIEPESIGELTSALDLDGTSLALLTCEHPDGGGFGRVERSAVGAIERIVELKDDTPDARNGPVEVNTGLMAIDADWLRAVAARLRPSPVTGEVYLTQLAEIAVADGTTIGSAAGSECDLVGVNDRVDLAYAEQVLQRKLREHHQRAGVTFVNGESTTLAINLSIAPDVTIEQGCVLRDGTSIGSGSVIGPYAMLDRATIGQNCHVIASLVTASVLDDGSDVGPYSHVRAGSRIGAGVHVGNFAEVKNSSLGDDVRMGHFSYVGDATIGAATNIGAGVVTCNFDGVAKHETDVGRGVFLGSDTMLVAPVHVGDGAATGAGSVVTHDVAAGEKVVGVPARPIAPKPEGDRIP